MPQNCPFSQFFVQKHASRIQPIPVAPQTSCAPPRSIDFSLQAKKNCATVRLSPFLAQNGPFWPESLGSGCPGRSSSKRVCASLSPLPPPPESSGLVQECLFCSCNQKKSVRSCPNVPVFWRKQPQIGEKAPGRPTSCPRICPLAPFAPWPRPPSLRLPRRPMASAPVAPPPLGAVPPGLASQMPAAATSSQRWLSTSSASGPILSHLATAGPPQTCFFVCLPNCNRHISTRMQSAQV